VIITCGNRHHVGQPSGTLNWRVRRCPRDDRYRRPSTYLSQTRVPTCRNGQTPSIPPAPWFAPMHRRPKRPQCVFLEASCDTCLPSRWRPPRVTRKGHRIGQPSFHPRQRRCRRPLAPDCERRRRQSPRRVSPVGTVQLAEISIFAHPSAPKRNGSTPIHARLWHCQRDCQRRKPFKLGLAKRCRPKRSPGRCFAAFQSCGNCSRQLCRDAPSFFGWIEREIVIDIAGRRPLCGACTLAAVEELRRNRFCSRKQIDGRSDIFLFR